MICMQKALFSMTNAVYADALQRKGKDFEIPADCIAFAYSAVLHFPETEQTSTFSSQQRDETK